MAAFAECRLEEGSSSSSEESELAPELAPRQSEFRRGYRIAALLLFAPAALAVAALVYRPHIATRRGNAGSSVALFGAFDYAQWAQATFGGPLKQVRDNIRKSKPVSNRTLMRLSNLTGKDLAPKEHMHDGNPCCDDEEEFMGLCYSSCATLTGGTHPIRTTAFACCREEPCTFMNSRF